MINDVKRLGLEVGGQRWKILGRYLYLGVIVVGTAYVAFENFVHALLGLCGFLAVAGFVLFTPYGKAVEKYTVFQERNIALLVIIVSFAVILVHTSTLVRDGSMLSENDRSMLCAKCSLRSSEKLSNQPMSRQSRSDRQRQKPSGSSRMEEYSM